MFVPEDCTIDTHLYTTHHHIHIHTYICTPSPMHPLQADEEMKQEQQRRVAEEKKLDMQEQLVHEVTRTSIYSLHHAHTHTHCVTTSPPPHMHPHTHTQHTPTHNTCTQVGKRKAAEAMDKERERRVDETEHISEEEAERRLVIARKMLDVQKELLATHAPTKVGHAPTQVGVV